MFVLPSLRKGRFAFTRCPSLLHGVPCPHNIHKLEYCFPDSSFHICYPKLQELKMLFKKNNVRKSFSELISQCRKHISYQDTY